MEWYPQNKEKLSVLLDGFISRKNKKEVNGLIVPHAGYEFSGAVAGKAFSLVGRFKQAVVFGPSHYVAFDGVALMNKKETPLGKFKIPSNSFQKLKYEHSVDNQLPFLQKLGINEILPIVVGEIDEKEAEEIARDFLEKYKDALFVFSSDLSHFLSYGLANESDSKTIDIIRGLENNRWREMDACGIFPLLIMMKMCQIKGWKPKLIEYKNSGDVTGDKNSVVGYSSFYF